MMPQEVACTVKLSRRPKLVIVVQATIISAQQRALASFYTITAMGNQRSAITAADTVTAPYRAVIMRIIRTIAGQTLVVHGTRRHLVRTQLFVADNLIR